MSTPAFRLIRSTWRGIVLAGLTFSILASLQAAEERIPELRPPRPELPPGFWDQYWFWIVAAVLVMLTLTAAAALLWVRFKVPPALAPLQRAHEVLEPLLAQAEDGAVLTRASQAVKGYFQSAFQLPQGEYNTSEFCRVVETKAQIGPELGSALGDFLRRCDRRKFAPVTSREPLGAARAALTLVDTGERRRMDLAREAERTRKHER